MVTEASPAAMQLSKIDGDDFWGVKKAYRELRKRKGNALTALYLSKPLSIEKAVQFIKYEHLTIVVRDMHRRQPYIAFQNGEIIGWFRNRKRAEEAIQRNPFESWRRIKPLRRNHRKKWPKAAYYKLLQQLQDVGI